VRGTPAKAQDAISRLVLQLFSSGFRGNDDLKG
jgi:hypothetical protein